MAAKAVLNVIAPLREMQSESDGEDVPSDSDEEEESSDESKHQNLLKAIDSLTGKSKKRHKVDQRSEPNVKVSEFNLSSSADQDDRVALKDLVGALHNDAGYGSLKKKLDSMHKKAAVLDVPLAKPAAEKVQRTVAFEETAKDIGKWAPIVKKNREPRTPLEEEVMAVLQGSSHLMERKNKELTEEEEKALLAMDLQEAKERRHELQKLRALQSYYEAKCRRAKKIKSKKYHREKRKAEKRSAQKLLGDPENAEEELEKAEKLRAEERVSLKHRNTSKWAKNLILKGNKNTDARKALQEQLRISRNLTEKKMASDSDKEEDLVHDAEVEEENTPSSTFGTLVTDKDNPWSIETKASSTGNANSGESSERFKFRRLEPVMGDEAKMAVSSDESGAEDPVKSEDEFELQLAEKTKASAKKKKTKGSSSEGKKKKSGQKQGKEIAKSQDTGKDRRVPKKKPSSKAPDLPKSSRKGNKKTKSFQDKKAETSGKRKRSSGKKESESEGVLSENESFGEDERKDNRNSGSEAQAEEVLKTRKRTEKGGIWKEVEEKSKDALNIQGDPKKIFRIEDDGASLEMAGEEGQRLNIHQAFANDDVIEEFAREKAETEEASKPKELDLTLPGWGEWGGAGMKVSEKKKKKKKRFVIPAAPAPPRKDRHLAHVIISENQDKKFAKNQAEHLSFPLNPYVPPRNNTRTLASNFKPRTPLEEEVMAVLQGSSHLMERKNKQLTEEEEKALLAMDLQETKERRHELQKLRALQSCYEAKCRRAKKIESKMYHREKRKAEKRPAQKLQGDPENAEEEMEKAEKLRAEERVSLKHRNTSKWAKNLMLKGNKNTDARKALQEQLRISRNLTEKKMASDSDKEEDLVQDAEVEEENTPSSTFGTLVTDKDNPWSIETKASSTGNANSGESSERLKFRRLEPVMGDEAKMAVSSDGSGAEDPRVKSEDEFELQLPEKTKASAKKKKTKGSSSEGKKKKSGQKQGKEIAKSQDTGKEKRETKKKPSSKAPDLPKSSRKGNKKTKSLQDKKAETSGKKRKRSLGKEESESEGVLGENESFGEDERQASRNSGSETQAEEVLKTRKRTEKGGIWKEVEEKSKEALNIQVDPKKIFRIEDDGASLEMAGEEGQRLNIQQAFANDDVIEEFAREKAETEEAAKPKELDLTLPGWGEWGEAGMKVSEKKKKKKRFFIPAETAPPRKDRHLAHVIISENQDNKFAKNQVSSLPHPYTSQAQFERSIRNPVGKHWNTSSTVKELTTPRVTTLVGTIIDPIKATKDIKRRKPQEVSGKNKKMRRRKDAAGSGITIYD